jgi:hypothetical protein
VLVVGNGYAVSTTNRGKVFGYNLPVSSTSAATFTATLGDATSAFEGITQDMTHDFIADCNDHMVRAVARPMGNASTVAFTLTGASVGPEGLVADSSGNLYAAEDCAPTTEIDLWSAPVTSSSTVSQSAVDAANISSPTQLAVDNVNHLLYLAQCTSTKQVLQYTLPLTSASTASVAVNIASEGCTEGIAIDAATNQLFVGSHNINNIYVFSLPITGASTPTLTITTPTAARRFRDMAFDSAGNLYVVDTGTTSVDIFVPPFTATSDPTFTLTPTGLDSPWGLNLLSI